MGYRMVVVGATGNVGREILNVLAERQFPADEVAAVASPRSTGDIIDFGDSGKELKVQNIEHFDFEGWDIALFAAGSEVSRVHAPRAAAAGCTVIDNSSLYRMDPDVPLIVPEVNPEAIDGYRAKNIIANPNCSTAQMVVALKPLHDAATIKRVVVATYQSVSGAGKAGMDELFEQSRNIFVGDSNAPVKFTKQIAFNVIPHIDELPRRRIDQGRMEDGRRDQEDPRLVDQGQRDLRPRAGVRRPFAKRSTSSSRTRFRPSRRRRSCARRPASCWSISARTAATSPRSNASATMPPSSAACARTRPSTMASASGSSATTSARARRLNAVQIAELLGRRHLQKAA